MNQRIQELVDQCTEMVTGIDEVEFFDKEKFAELIVRECVGIAMQSSHRDDDMGAIIANKIGKEML